MQAPAKGDYCVVHASRRVEWLSRQLCTYPTGSTLPRLAASPRQQWSVVPEGSYLLPLALLPDSIALTLVLWQCPPGRPFRRHDCV